MQLFTGFMMVCLLDVNTYIHTHTHAHTSIHACSSSLGTWWYASSITYIYIRTHKHTSMHTYIHAKRTNLVAHACSSSLGTWWYAYSTWCGFFLRRSSRPRARACPRYRLSCLRNHIYMCVCVPLYISINQHKRSYWRQWKLVYWMCRGFDSRHSFEAEGKSLPEIQTNPPCRSESEKRKKGPAGTTGVPAVLRKAYFGSRDYPVAPNLPAVYSGRHGGTELSA